MHLIQKEIVFKVKVLFLHTFVCVTEVGEKIGKEFKFKIRRFVVRKKFGHDVSVFFFLYWWHRKRNRKSRVTERGKSIRRKFKIKLEISTVEGKIFIYRSLKVSFPGVGCQMFHDYILFESSQNSENCLLISEKSGWKWICSRVWKKT